VGRTKRYVTLGISLFGLILGALIGLRLWIGWSSPGLQLVIPILLGGAALVLTLRQRRERLTLPEL